MVINMILRYVSDSNIRNWSNSMYYSECWQNGLHFVDAYVKTQSMSTFISENCFCLMKEPYTTHCSCWRYDS